MRVATVVIIITITVFVWSVDFSSEKPEQAPKGFRLSLDFCI